MEKITDFCTPEGLRNQHHEHHLFLCVDLPIHAAWNGTTVSDNLKFKGSFAVAFNSYSKLSFFPSRGAKVWP